MDKDTLSIELVSTASDGLVTSMNTLMQQLSPNLPILSKTDLQAIIDDKDTWLFIARDSANDSAIGTLTLVNYKTPSGKRGYVEDVVVDSSYRGKGIGAMLMDKGIEKAKELGLEYIGLTSRPQREAANRLYQKLGFEKRDTNVYRMMLDKK